MDTTKPVLDVQREKKEGDRERERVCVCVCQTFFFAKREAELSRTRLLAGSIESLTECKTEEGPRN